MPIFDQGYQHWRGPLSGHAWRWLTIARRGLRVQLKGRMLRLLLGLALVPALGLVIVMALWGLIETKTEGLLALLSSLLPADVLLDPRAYRTTVWTLAYSFFFKAEMFVIMLLVVVAGPGLISGDLRFNALPLYFARPLNRSDYFLGKLGVIGLLVAWVAVVPAVFAYIVGFCFSLDSSVFKDTWRILLASIGYGLVITASAGTLMLALSSLTRRSLYVGIAWAGIWLISGSVGGALTGIHRESLREAIYQEKMKEWDAANPPPPGVRAADMFRQLRPRPGLRGPPPIRFGQPGGKNAWLEAREKASQDAMIQAGEARSAELRRDWRPLCSYVMNLERIADEMLDTDAAWLKIGRSIVRSEEAARAAMGPGRGPDVVATMDERFLADQMVYQHPWEWSGGVLVGLLGLSLWILTQRVKSLDRLK